ncbi:hypothetical protein KFL_000820230 [Klebsormidium nitens]|uniref:FAD-binding domain-containing protein n=1 Tax=Klebsormidium nitens TaxID=105231 RepID=A0A1Y1HSA8_KLENI|nr:hypothetical protein KFL_000820230 [Klebsormidium nitens]|eukprot:GAQ81515.1 hypothetical protein KFL_000820230 [Klebsormidium nitens]
MAPCTLFSGPTSANVPIIHPKPTDVVIIGAGPGGLLLALYLLEKGQGRFKVSIHEAREDPRETLKRPPSPRRSPLGIWHRGLAALQRIEGLWPRVNAVGAPAFVCKVWVLGRFLSVPHRAEDSPKIVTDRCALCAAMMDLLLARYGGSGLLDITFDQRCTSVDLRTRSVTFAAPAPSADRNSEGQPGPDQASDVGEWNRTNGTGITKRYDLIVGADGVHSVVRQGIVQSTRRFDFEQRDIGWEWLVTRVPVPPPPVKGDWGLIVLGKPFALLTPGCPSLEGDSQMNFVIGWTSHEKPPEWHACTTAEDAKAYLDRAYPWLNIPLKSAEALLKQRVNTSMQLKCSVYHDTEGRAVLIGDAAHATSPTLGQGCNTALEDAATLASLLLETETVSELPDALESYSGLRVPEGHALVDVAESQGPMDRWGVIRNILNMVWQTMLNRLFPKLFPPHILISVSAGKPLSEIYKANKGFVDSVLASNQRAVRRLTEKRNQERTDAMLAKRFKAAPAGS